MNSKCCKLFIPNPEDLKCDCHNNTSPNYNNVPMIYLLYSLFLSIYLFLSLPHLFPAFLSTHYDSGHYVIHTCICIFLYESLFKLWSNTSSFYYYIHCLILSTCTIVCVFNSVWRWLSSKLWELVLQHHFCKQIEIKYI